MVCFASKFDDKKSQIEMICREYFNVNLPVSEIIGSDIPSSKDSYTTIFRDSKGVMYALCESDEPLILGDIRSIINAMGIKASEYLPPKADYDYFSRHGRRVYQSVYPNRATCGEADLTYYKTMSPYSIALIRVARINGEIREYNDFRKRWQSAFDINYMKTQVQ